jgi:MFS family permease
VAKWLAAAGAFVMSLDSTVNIAFPSMAAAFAVPVERVRWVIICYVLTYALVSFAGGALGDRVGHHRVFRAGVALSAVAYVLCGTAASFGALLLGRVVQGVAGGLVYGTAPALVTREAPPAARGQALGFLNAAIGAAFAVAPVVGGALVERFGWPAVFHVRLPLALLLLLWTIGGLRESRRPTTRPVLAPAALARGPMLTAGALAFLANAGIFAIWFLAPFYLVERRGLGALIGSVLFMLTPLGTALAAPLAGRLADRIGVRAPMVGGLLLEAASLVLLAQVGPATPPLLVGLALLAAGFGLGVFQVPNMTAVMAEFGSGQQGAAGGFAFLARTLGTVGGVALLAEVFAARGARAGFDGGFSAAFLVAGGVVAAGAAVATRRWPDRSA